MHFAASTLLLDGNSPRKVTRFLAYPLISWLFVSAALHAATSHALKEGPLDQGVQRVRAVLEVEGELKLNSDGKSVRRIPLQVHADLIYDEMRLANHDKARRSARIYRQAKASIEVNQHGRTPTGTTKLVQVHAGTAKPVLFSPEGPLSRDELELIDIPGNSLVLPRLLPNRAVKRNQSWTVGNDVYAALLGLDTIATADVKHKLTAVQDYKATIYFSGKVEGASGGVVSEIDIKANYEFDLRKRRVNWLTMVIKEDRAIGHAQPGFEVTARLQLIAKPVSDSPLKKDSRLGICRKEPNDGDQALSLASRFGGFEFLHERDWQMMVDRPDLAIMRLVRGGDLITQCNIRNLPELKEGEQLTLEGFRDDIRKSLDKRFGDFIEASEKAENGIRILRVVVAGVVSELPIQWHYYHLSDDQGRRISLAFTTESKLVERFGAADELIVGSFRFAERVQPTPAKPVEKRESADEPAAKTATKPAAKSAAKSAAKLSDEVIK